MPVRRSIAACAATVLIAAAACAASPAIERGRIVATRSGCLSCHGPDLAGKAILSDPTIALLYSSNLTRAAPRYSDRALERTIRTAVRPDGSHLWQMGTGYALLTRADMKDLIAFIRAKPRAGDDHPRIAMGPRFIRAVKAGRLQPEAIEQARDTKVPPDFGPRLARGRYLARTICAGCHYPSLDGRPDAQDGDAPNLALVQAYDRDQFRTLLRTGVAIGGRAAGTMSEEAPRRFAVLTDAEIDALRDYLLARATHRPGSTRRARPPRS